MIYHHLQAPLVVNTSSVETPSLNNTAPYYVDKSPIVHVLDDSFTFDEGNYVQTMSPVYSKLEYQSDIADCTLKVLKTLRHQAKCSSNKLKEFSQMCLMMFRNKFDDIAFMENLANDLGFQDNDELILYQQS